jgi:hypothetical protein
MMDMINVGYPSMMAETKIRITCSHLHSYNFKSTNSLQFQI